MTTDAIREAIEREDEENEADEEAELAEAEQSDEGGDDDDESAEAAQPQPQPPASDAELEAVWKRIDTKQRNYATDQAKLLDQTGMMWSECPCCPVPGFVPPFDPSDPDELERQTATQSYFAGGAPPLETAEEADACPKCNGYGEVLTGSRNPNFRVKACVNCGGQGWVDKATLQAQRDARDQTPGVVASTSPDMGGVLVPDLWQRPPGHRDYGLPPALVNA